MHNHFDDSIMRRFQVSLFSLVMVVLGLSSGFVFIGYSVREQYAGLWGSMGLLLISCSCGAFVMNAIVQHRLAWLGGAIVGGLCVVLYVACMLIAMCACGQL